MSGRRCPLVGKVSKGKYVVPHFAAKDRIDDSIRSLPELLAKTTFLYVTFYASNLQYPVFGLSKSKVSVNTCGSFHVQRRHLALLSATIGSIWALLQRQSFPSRNWLET